MKESTLGQREENGTWGKSRLLIPSQSVRIVGVLKDKTEGGKGSQDEHQSRTTNRTDHVEMVIP